MENEIVTMSSDVALNTLWVLVCAFLVFFMNTGFGCLEAGFCRAKNAVNILAKNFVVFAAASLAFWAVGFALMFGDGNALFGLAGWFLGGADSSPLVEDAYTGVYSSLNWAGVPLTAKFFFQLAFAATAATIVSGCVAERIHYKAFIIFAFVITAVLYPITGHWIWGGGWLAELGMWDFAGSTVVHSVGGWAGLTGILLLGPRLGKFRKDGSVSPIPGHSMPLVFLGGMILWLGWFGFNPGSTMGITGDNAVAVSHIVVTTNLACAAGILAATLVAYLLFGKPDFGMTVNGALAGLVAITAGCAFVSAGSAILIGLIGGAVVVFAVRFFDKVRIDDPVGALSVHLVCGIWGTLAIGLFAQQSAPGGIDRDGLFFGGGLALLGIQALGVVAVGAFAVITSAAVWSLIKATVTLRVGPTVEAEGLDINEMGNEAYPHEPAIDIGAALRVSALGRHESVVLASEQIRSTRAAAMPPDGPTYTVVLDNLDKEKFMQLWRNLCSVGNGSTGNGNAEEFGQIYRYFTTVVDGRLRFRGGDPAETRRMVEKLARSVSASAVASVEGERHLAA